MPVVLSVVVLLASSSSAAGWDRPGSIERAASSPDPVVLTSLVSPGAGWVLSRHSLKRTTDDGRHWTTVTPAGLSIHPASDPGLGATNVYGFGALDSRHAFLATEALNNVDFTMTIWRTADGGATWHRTTLPHLVHETGPICGQTCGAGFGVTFHPLSPTDAFMDYGYVQGTDSEIHPLYRTSDGGASWRRVGTGTTSLDLQLAFRTTSTIVMADGRSLFSTTTGWDHLAAATLDGPVEVGLISGVTFWNARSWILGLQSASEFELALTTDSGRSWEFRRRTLPQPGPGLSYVSVLPIAFLDPAGWLAAAKTCTVALACTSSMWKTADRGHTWQRSGQLPAGVEPYDGVQFVDALHGWAGGGDSSKLYTTADGGRTWRQLRP